ncbi:hypothetical protein J7E49_06230 [Variovorax paradoxus]|nr:hypothetical protein [Variovorax paradoxus]
MLHRIFLYGDRPSMRQRFGDSNQAIYAHVNADGAQTDCFPSATVHNLPRSYRFSQGIAEVARGLGIVPQALVGAGPTRARVQCAARAPVLFLFDDASVQEVLPRFLQRHPLLLMPVSWRDPFPVDADQRGSAAMREILDAQSPLLSTAILGLPGLSVPMGMRRGLPTGVQLVGDRFCEDLCLAAAEVLESEAGPVAVIDPV